MTILFNLASRSRPERFFETLDNIIRHCSSRDYFIVAKLDNDDVTMTDADVRAWLRKDYPQVIVKWGTSASKIHAINRDINDVGLPKWDILINMSDDMRWGTYGFDEIIRKAMPESLDAFIHVPDDYAKDRVCTTSVIGYRYYLRDMRVYYDGYYSMWSDDEETEKAKRRGCYIFLPEVIALEHLHYTNNAKAKKDELYWRNDTYNADKEIFEQRKARNFDL